MRRAPSTMNIVIIADSLPGLSSSINGSALMEEDKPGKESAMITMFIVDGARLIATHYCSVGNQPQMVSEAPDDFRKGVTFSLARVTGLKSPTIGTTPA